VQPQIGIYYWVRVGVMILTLVGVLSVMYRLKPTSFLGGSNANSVNLCPTRVASVAMIGRFALIQDGMKWYRAEQGERTELDQIAAEKWFGAHCKVSAEQVESNEGASPLLTLAYVSGSPKTILMSPDGVFTMDQSHFRSLQLVQAITALENLPIATKPGQNNK